MKSVLMSIQPKWCELIASGEKTVEVRKTKPKLDAPFKVYIYCTADRRKHICDTFVPQTPLFVKNGVAKSSIGKEDGLPWKLGNGKVIGEFVCDKIQEITYTQTYNFGRYKDVCEAESRLDFYALDDYLKQKNGYGWHISDLVIYDKPRELSEFKRLCKNGVRFEVESKAFFDSCLHCPHLVESDSALVSVDCSNTITRPPQSWCYVEGKNDDT